MEDTNKNTLRIRFFGAIGITSGSCTLLEYFSCNEKKKLYFLVDAGSFEDEDCEQAKVRSIFLNEIAKKIKIIFITHSHKDHIGYLPELIKHGFRGKIYCTQATHNLIILNLSSKDSKKDNNNYLRSISFIDIEKLFKQGFGKNQIRIAKDFMCGFLRSGHILGACSFYFEWTENNYGTHIQPKNKEWKRIHFSGDIGPNSKKTLSNIIYKCYQTPQFDDRTNYIIMESTFGDKYIDKENIIKDRINKLSNVINNAIKTNRSIVIVASTLDILQHILIDLLLIFFNIENKRNIISLERTDYENINKIYYEANYKYKDLINYNEIFIKNISDYFLSKNVNDLIKDEGNRIKFKYLSDDFLNNFNLTDTDFNTLEKRINELLSISLLKKVNKPKIYIFTTKMFNSGKYADFLKKYLLNINTIVLIAGLHLKNTNGYYLKNLYNYKNYEMRDISIDLKSENIRLKDIKSQIEDMTDYYFDHADQEQLIEYITPKEDYKKTFTVLLNHGTNASYEALKNKIEEKICNVHIEMPKFNEWLNLSTFEYEEEDIIIDNNKDYKIIKVNDIYIKYPINYRTEKLEKIKKFIENMK